MDIPSVSFLATLPLKHNGDCNLIGVTPGSRDDLTIYAEEVYGEEGWLAQHSLRFDGSFSASVDEFFGTATDLKPLALPPEIVRPKTGWHTMALNFAGPRHRGLRTPERTLDLVRPLSIQEKMALIERLKLDLMPPLLLGIGESYVLAETEIIHPNLYFVCRRVRLAVALAEARLDADDQPYDYETQVLYLAHFYEREQEPAITDILGDLTAVPLRRPMDCLWTGNHLFIADGGADDRLSAIHVWQIDLPGGSLSEAEKLQKKIYG